jgi:hypothetical protein
MVTVFSLACRMHLYLSQGIARYRGECDGLGAVWASGYTPSISNRDETK